MIIVNIDSFLETIIYFNLVFVVFIKNKFILFIPF